MINTKIIREIEIKTPVGYCYDLEWHTPVILPLGRLGHSPGLGFTMRCYEKEEEKEEKVVKQILAYY